MAAKDLRIDTVLDERNERSNSYSHGGAAGSCPDTSKSFHDIGIASTSKSDVQTVRPCAVIGPDRIISQPTSNVETYSKKPQENWIYNDVNYNKQHDYPQKIGDHQHPSRNISPRQTFQENMPRIMVPPRLNIAKMSNDSINYSSERNVLLNKNLKFNVPAEPKYCDVPYTVNTVTNEQRNSARNSEMCVNNVNPMVMRNPAHSWLPPAGSPQHVARGYAPSDIYCYPEYSTAPRSVTVGRPLRSIHEEPSPYGDPYSRSGNVRFEPYPTSKERYPPTRYDYIGNYSNPYHAQNFPPHKYAAVQQKSFPPQSFIGYPQVPLKYLEPRLAESHIEYQRSNPAPAYNMPYHTPNLPPNYIPAGKCIPNKLYTYPDNTNKSSQLIKNPYENPNKVNMDYDNNHLKNYAAHENFYINEMSRPHHSKGPMIVPNYPHMNMHAIPPQTLGQVRKDNSMLKSYEYMNSHYKNMESNNNVGYTHLRVPPPYTANIISPSDSHTNNYTTHTLGMSQEDCGYVSQGSTTSGKSVEHGNRFYNYEAYKRYDYQYGCRSPSSSKQLLNKSSENKDKKNIDLRQYLQMWNEGVDECNENNKETSVSIPNSNEIQKKSDNNEEQLYVLGLVTVPKEELDKYEHIQKVSKLPENIKGYNSLELLHQFEEVIGNSNFNSNKSIPVRDPQESKKSLMHSIDSNTFTRPLSPLDVESKISQSVIHKEVGCNFEIKPCSPEMLNVERAAPVQTIFGERKIEKITNPHIARPSLLKIEDSNVNCNIRKQQNNHQLSLAAIPSCKMLKTSYTTNNESVKNSYTLQDLESNSGVCLASLPRLDTDIELNFPEVNQQFIDANKDEPIMSSNMSTLNSFENIKPNIKQSKQNVLSPISTKNQEEDTSMSPGYDNDNNYSKLSKFRRTKLNKKNVEGNSNTDIQAQRTNSVIIKNPDTFDKNTSLLDDKTVTIDISDKLYNMTTDKLTDEPIPTQTFSSTLINLHNNNGEQQSNDNKEHIFEESLTGDIRCIEGNAAKSAQDCAVNKAMNLSLNSNDINHESDNNSKELAKTSNNHIINNTGHEHVLSDKTVNNKLPSTFDECKHQTSDYSETKESRMDSGNLTLREITHETNMNDHDNSVNSTEVKTTLTPVSILSQLEFGESCELKKKTDEDKIIQDLNVHKSPHMASGNNVTSEISLSTEGNASKSSLDSMSELQTIDNHTTSEQYISNDVRDVEIFTNGNNDAIDPVCNNMDSIKNIVNKNPEKNDSDESVVDDIHNGTETKIEIPVTLKNKLCDNNSDKLQNVSNNEAVLSESPVKYNSGTSNQKLPITDLLNKDQVHEKICNVNINSISDCLISNTNKNSEEINENNTIQYCKEISPSSDDNHENSEIKMHLLQNQVENVHSLNSEDHNSCNLVDTHLCSEKLKTDAISDSPINTNINESGEKLNEDFLKEHKETCSPKNNTINSLMSSENNFVEDDDNCEFVEPKIGCLQKQCDNVQSPDSKGDNKCDLVETKLLLPEEPNMDTISRCLSNIGNCNIINEEVSTKHCKRSLPTINNAFASVICTEDNFIKSVTTREFVETNLLEIQCDNIHNPENESDNCHVINADLHLPLKQYDINVCSPNIKDENDNTNKNLTITENNILIENSLSKPLKQIISKGMLKFVNENSIYDDNSCFENQDSTCGNVLIKDMNNKESESKDLTNHNFNNDYKIEINDVTDGHKKNIILSDVDTQTLHSQNNYYNRTESDIDNVMHTSTRISRVSQLKKELFSSRFQNLFNEFGPCPEFQNNNYNIHNFSENPMNVDNNSGSDTRNFEEIPLESETEEVKIASAIDTRNNEDIHFENKSINDVDIISCKNDKLNRDEYGKISSNNNTICSHIQSEENNPEKCNIHESNHNIEINEQSTDIERKFIEDSDKNTLMSSNILNVFEKENQKNKILPSNLTSRKLPNRRIKRSLSESFVYAITHTNNTCTQNGENNLQATNDDEGPLAWYAKRKKKNHLLYNNIPYSELIENCSIVQNSRRNSTSSIFNEDVSFCIYVDNSSIADESHNFENDVYEGDDYQYGFQVTDETTNFDNIETSTAIGEDIEIPKPTSNLNSPESHIYVHLEEPDVASDIWVDDIACVETVVSDNVEDIEDEGDYIKLDTSSSNSDTSKNLTLCDPFNVSMHSAMIQHIYGNKIGGNDIKIVEALYNTPQMNVNDKLNEKESHGVYYEQDCEKFDNRSLHDVLSEPSNYQETLGVLTNNLINSLEADSPDDLIDNSSVGDTNTYENIPMIGCIDDPLLISNNVFETDDLHVSNANLIVNHNKDKLSNKLSEHHITQDDTVHSCEFSNGDSISNFETNLDECSSGHASSPEVTSTTTEEKKSGILLKITNYKGSRVSIVEENSLQTDYCEKKSRCKFTELNHYVTSKISNDMPLITKAAKKYIPPLKIYHDLKIRLPLPQKNLQKLKELKSAKEKLKNTKDENIKESPNQLNKFTIKKIKPNFEDVLKNIDEVQYKLHKSKSSKKHKKDIPKVIIKKNENGSHYASTSKIDYNPDLTGRKWQPWVFLEKINFIDKMALRNKTTAIFCHKRKMFVLAEKFHRWQAINNLENRNTIIKTPLIDNMPKLPLKYTIRLKHTY